MRFQIEHETRYRYNQPVFFEPHIIRLKPRSDSCQKLVAFSLRVYPPPEGISEITDACGNHALRVWFSGLHEEMVLHIRLTAASLRENPFDYLLDDSAFSLPLKLSAPEAAVLAPCLGPKPDAAAHNLAQQIMRQTGGDTQAFLTELNQWLYREIKIEPREDPGLQGVECTLGGKSGACRDVSLVFMQTCRAVGLPARYVSCYQRGDENQDTRDLHAFAEVYLPGAGWRGFDPTLGLVVADEHLAICASPLPELCAPVSGSFRGTGARGELEHNIELKIIP